MPGRFSSFETTPLPAAAPVPVADPRRPWQARALAVLAFGALALGMAVAPAAASTQLSEGLPFSDVAFFPTRPQISPNGQYAVYLQDAVIDNAPELWSVRLDGSTAPERLSDPLVAANSDVTFAISPDSARVVYLVDQDTFGAIELYSVPIAGGARVKLHPNLTSPRYVLNFLISPTSDLVFFIQATGSSDLSFQLYSVPISGGTPVRLNADLAFDVDVEGFRVNPAGTMVVYRAGWDSGGFWELFSVPATGPSDEVVKLSQTLPPAGGDVDPYFQISPNGTRVVYLADTTATGAYNLYSVAIGGGVPIKLNSTLPPPPASVDNGDVSQFQISANSSRVVYRADGSSAGVYQLYSVPLLGGTVSRLNGTLGTNEDVEPGYLISADSNTVVYRSDEDLNDIVDLYSVALSGTGTPTKLNGALTGLRDVLDFAISPNSARVVYSADEIQDTLNELFTVAIGGGPATRLNPTLNAGGDVQKYRISPNSSWVIFGADQVDTLDELFAVPIAGGSVLKVNETPVFGGDVVLKFIQTTVFEISSNSVDVVYVADQDVDDDFELYVSSLGGPPGPPTDVVAVPGSLQALVTFLPPASDGGSGITGFTVSSNPPGGVDSIAGSTDLSHLITNLVNGTAYTFTVRATNVHGEGDPSVPSEPVTPATVPGAPTAVVATGWHRSATVAFAAPGSNGGSAITGYTVTSAPAGGIDRHAGTTGLNHYVFGLTNGVPYTFTVVATNVMGPGPASAPSNLATPACNLFCDDLESGNTSAWDFTTTPALTILKTATSSGPYAVDDPITYSIVVTNTGNVTLTGAVVTDPGATVEPCTPAQPATLAPAATLTCPATHVVTQADLDAGSYTNTATAGSDQTDPASDDEVVIFAGIS